MCCFCIFPGKQLSFSPAAAFNKRQTDFSQMDCVPQSGQQRGALVDLVNCFMREEITKKGQIMLGEVESTRLTNKCSWNLLIIIINFYIIFVE